MIKGFEEDVGTKTSFYGFTVNTMKNSLISYKKLGFTSVPQGQVRPSLAEPLHGKPQGPQAQSSGCSCARILGTGMGLLRRVWARMPQFQAVLHNFGLECEGPMFTESLRGASNFHSPRQPHCAGAQRTAVGPGF